MRCEKRISICRLKEINTARPGCPPSGFFTACRWSLNNYLDAMRILLSTMKRFRGKLCTTSLPASFHKRNCSNTKPAKMRCMRFTGSRIAWSWDYYLIRKNVTPLTHSNSWADKNVLPSVRSFFFQDKKIHPWQQIRSSTVRTTMW